ncbi:hypothetical protein ACFC0K_02860 [Streptomyces hydrogenans]|uniref:hypothetical protein n=1 Tax=Streptomyces hydrogenans TaxID=1873719 RepID=UPI0035E14B6D
MSRTRPSRPLLTAAVLTAGAVTGTLAAAPATVAGPLAAPVTAPLAAAEDVAPFPKGGTLLSGGRTGFLARAGTGTAPYFWTSYDGTVTALPGARHLGADGSDTVVQDSGDGTYTLRDMGSDAPPVVITTPGRLVAVVDTTLVIQDAGDIHLVDKVGDQVLRRTVTGLPASGADVVSTAPGALAVRTGSPSAQYLSLVHLSSASVVKTVQARNSILGFESVAVSKTHLTWYDYTAADDGASYWLYDTGSGRTRELGGYGGGEWAALSADWRALGGTGGLSLHSLTDNRALTVLDRVRGVRPGADGAFLVDGTLDRVEGIYRVTVGADGKAAAELVASSGRLPDLVVTTEQVPSVLDFDATERWVEFAWDFNHPVDPVLTLTHKATGRQWSFSSGHHSPPPTYRFTLGSRGSWGDIAVYDGEYSWKMTATEVLNVGPSLERTGTLTVNRTAAHRDHDENGNPDLLVRDGAGVLSAYETKLVREAEYALDPVAPTVLGTGWNTYTLMASPSERTLVGRDRDGVLWLHKGVDQKLLPRTKVGGGWQVYDKITGGSDLNGDGRGDLLATDTSGVLWLYVSTGDTRTPFKPRVRIGGGWQTYNLLLAPGDIAGASGGDLLARDKDGVLWLYLGKGDGTFTARRKIGGGWQQFTHLAPFGDRNEDGRIDLYAIGTKGSRIYPTTGTVDHPYGTPETLRRTSDTTFKTVF